MITDACHFVIAHVVECLLQELLGLLVIGHLLTHSVIGHLLTLLLLSRRRGGNGCEFDCKDAKYLKCSSIPNLNEKTKYSKISIIEMKIGIFI